MDGERVNIPVPLMLRKGRRIKQSGLSSGNQLPLLMTITNFLYSFVLYFYCLSRYFELLSFNVQENSIRTVKKNKRL